MAIGFYGFERFGDLFGGCGVSGVIGVGVLVWDAGGLCVLVLEWLCVVGCGCLCLAYFVFVCCFGVCLAVADWLLVKLFRFCWLVYGCFYVTVLV